VGDYRVLGELGWGGMGVVYRARHEGIDRPVALKMIRAGVLADPQERRRFRNEVEAVARLDHPAIVPVYEVGEHEGQPYFSMPLIEGSHLGERLGAYAGDPRAAARLVAELAEAVHHAHARGVLHRDLKPANVLVDAAGRPHVTDFGLARRLDDAGEPGMTRTGAVVGTPAFMSPEQADGRRGAATTMTDVHGLGAILYALLTGRPPFEGDGLYATLEAVRERPPEPPRRLDRRVPRDLETIALKCLEKDPRRRYASAQALADDLRAWLGRRPIAARRVGPAGRFVLWCRRRPAAAALSAVVLLAPLLGAGGLIAVQARANAALRAANERERQRLDLAMEAIRLFEARVGDDPLLQDESLRPVRDELLGQAARFYERLERLLRVRQDPRSRAALADAHARIGDLSARVGDRARALAAHGQALAIRRALAAADPALEPDLAASLLALGRLRGESGDPAEGLAMLDEARRRLEAAPRRPDRDAGRAAVHQATGEVHLLRGAPDAAVAEFERARALRAGLVAGAPRDRARRDGLGRSLLSLAAARRAAGRRAEATATLEAASDLIAGRFTEDPKSRETILLLAQTLFDLGQAALDEGDAGPAVTNFGSAEQLVRPLVRDFPAVMAYADLRARALQGCATAARRLGATRTALDTAGQAIALFQDRLRRDPDATEARVQLARTEAEAGRTLRDARRRAEAVPRFRAAVAGLRHAAARRASPPLLDAMAATQAELAATLREDGRHAEASVAAREAVATWARSLRSGPATPAWRAGVPPTLDELARAARAAGQEAGSLDAITTLVDALDADARTRGDRAAGPDALADALDRRATALRGLGRPAEALAAARRAVALRESSPRPGPDPAAARLGHARSLLGLAAALRDAGDAPAAAASARAAVALHEAAPATDPAGRVALAAALATLAGGPAGPDADRAVAVLRGAIAAGFRDLPALDGEPALDPLRSRPEFPLLRQDAAMPADPFAAAPARRRAAPR
jgi:serine/threonine-protein kinase